jgi:hypothetical protein
VATLIYCGVCELIPGPLEKLVIHMGLMAVADFFHPPDGTLKVHAAFPTSLYLDLVKLYSKPSGHTPTTTPYTPIHS